tara:strand:- start:521 stop:703 length:183 start_codon:yes stop_codon:yes gene_type:complete
MDASTVERNFAQYMTTWMRRSADDFGARIPGPSKGKSRPRAAYHGRDIAPEHLNRLKARI